MASERLRVVLDPGHGGSPEMPHSGQYNFGGTGVASGEREAPFVLKIAKRIRDILNESERAFINLTRRDDTILPIPQRVPIALEFGAQILVSIHADELRPGLRGAACYYRNTKNLDWARHTERLASSVLANLQKVAFGGSEGVLAGFENPLRGDRKKLGVLNACDRVGIANVQVHLGNLADERDDHLLHQPEVREQVCKSIADGILALAPKRRTVPVSFCVNGRTVSLEGLRRLGKTLIPLEDLVSVLDAKVEPAGPEDQGIVVTFPAHSG